MLWVNLASVWAALLFWCLVFPSSWFSSFFVHCQMDIFILIDPLAVVYLQDTPCYLQRRYLFALPVGKQRLWSDPWTNWEVRTPILNVLCRSSLSDYINMPKHTKSGLTKPTGEWMLEAGAFVGKTGNMPAVAVINGQFRWLRYRREAEAVINDKIWHLHWFSHQPALLKFTWESKKLQKIA